MNESGVKQQIVDNIQNVDSILVTVGSNPSVDELSAALGLTMYLNDLGKHTTAVVSGNLPPAINFLEPEKTFESTVDSLRDFVIALDKEKADHLRYKVEGDVVKIFITPYKTVITSKDLDYSQGDYNVEMVVALGVTDQDHLDKALAAHGKIFHDAIVATIGTTPSTLGTIDWVEESASSMSELVTSLTESIQDSEKPMTPQVASALLTGIVAATERFSNDKTTSQTMSIAAILMAAGANQQLIASKLREGAKLPMQQDSGKKRPGSGIIKQDAPGEPVKRRDGGLSIAHKPGDDELEQKPSGVDKSTKQPAMPEVLKKPQVPEKKAPELAKPSVKPALPKVKTTEDILSEQLAAVAPSVASPPKLDIGPDTPVVKPGPAPEAPKAPVDDIAAPKKEEKPPVSSNTDAQQPSLDPFASLGPVTPPEPPKPATPTLADIDQQNRAAAPSPESASPSAESSAALDAVRAVMDVAPDTKPADPLEAIKQAAPQQPPAPIVAPEPLAMPVAPPPPPMPDFSRLPPLPPPPVFPQPSEVAPAAPAMPPVAPLGPQPPEIPGMPLPPEQLGSVLPEAPNQPPQPAGPADPKQFKIPGQP